MSTKRGIVHLLKDFSVEPNSQTIVPFEYNKYSMLLKAKNGIWLSINKLTLP